jgi:thioredoxin
MNNSNKTKPTGAPSDSLPVVISSAKFRSEVLECQQPVLVGFWTSWSRPCRVFDSVLQELARDWVGKIKIVKINADDSLDLSLAYEIQSIPTLIYFIEGKPCLRIVGTATKEAILEKLKPFAK